MIDKSLVRDGERVDDLQRDGLLIIQDPQGFCFGVDAVLLSDFAKDAPGDMILDMGTGTGIIPILLSSKTGAGCIKGLEIQERAVEMARRSVRLNSLSGRIEIIQGDIKEASTLFKKGSFDAITSNPPYMKHHRGLLNPDEPRALARHELKMSFEDLARESSLLLREGGRLYLIHRPLRIPEIFFTLKKFGLEPKRMRMVHPYPDQEANLVLIEARKGGGEELRTMPPLIVYREKGVYTRDIEDIYAN